MLNSISIALLKVAYAAKQAAGIPLQPNHVLQMLNSEAVETAIMAVAICRDLGETEFSANLVNNGIVDAAVNVTVPAVSDKDTAVANAIVNARMAIEAARPAMMAAEDAMRTARRSGDKAEYKRLRSIGCPEMEAAQAAYKDAVAASGVNPYATHCFDGWH